MSGSFSVGVQVIHSTETALIALHDDLLKEAKRGSKTLALLDFFAAFDTFNHSVVLDRRLGLGIGSLVFHWLWSFLNGCIQMVQLWDAALDPAFWGPT